MIRRPVTILLLLTGLNLLNYLDRYVVSAVLTRMEKDPNLLLSHTEGGLLATIFLVGYFATSPMFGALADRGSRKGLIALGVAIWSVATIATGFATAKWALFLARAIVGVGEASYATIAPTIIDDLTPPANKSRALAIFFAASPIGSALGYMVGGSVGQHFGWQTAFHVAGAPGLVLAGLCLLIEEPKRVNITPKVPLREIIRELLPIESFRYATFGYTAFTAAIAAFAYWAPSFLEQELKLSLAKGNIIFGGITVVAGTIGTIIGARLADSRAKRALSDAEACAEYLRVSAISTLIGVPLCVVCFLAPNPPIFFIFAGLAQIVLFMCTSPINACVMRGVPIARRASAMALLILSIHLFGDLWSPPVIGALKDVAPTRIALLLLPILFAIGGVIWLQGVKQLRAITKTT